VPNFAAGAFEGLVVLGNRKAEERGPVTRGTAPLSDQDTRADLNICEVPSRLVGGSSTPVNLHIVNKGSALWPALGREDGALRIAASYRWLHISGSEAIGRITRHGLDSDLPPSAATEIEVFLTAPKEPGHYIVEFDMVQERVCWFSERGSSPLRVQIEVVGPGD